MSSENKHLSDPHQVMDEVLQRGDAQQLAHRLFVTPQTIRNWTRPPETESEYTNTGRPGPLQRLGDIIDFIKAEDGSPSRAYPIGRHIAARLGGVFYPLPVVCGGIDSEATKRISAVLKESTEAVEEFRVAWFERGRGRITDQEMISCLKEIDEALAALMAMRTFIKSESGK